MKQIYLFVFFCLAFTLPTLSQTQIWTGATSSNWNTASNWSRNTVPTGANNVIIPATLLNQPIVSASGAVAKSVEVQSGATLTIQSTGTLAVNGANSDSFSATFLNWGTVENNGQLLIGNILSGALVGLLNKATFNNNTGGIISIDNATQQGLYNSAGTFNNSATIIIGATASNGHYGLYNYATFNNNTGGQIRIDNATFIGLHGVDGTFTNAASITIGATASNGKYGLANSATFNNTSGQISIDHLTEVGLLNGTGVFTNAAAITIGATASVGATGVSNYSTFNNTGCRALLQVRSDAVITDVYDGTTTNSGTIIENASGNSNIAANSGTVQNLNGGTFTITTNNGVNTTSTGTLWTGCTNTDWNTASNWSTAAIPRASDDVTIFPATNQPTISAATAAVAHSVAVQSGSVLTNSGSLTINGAKQVDDAFGGIYYGAAAFFNNGTVNNSGQLVIGNSAPVGSTGLYNYATFNNNTGGTIHIDNASSYDLFNYNGTFNNFATIIIGVGTATARVGLLNYATFNNTAGVIQIDNTMNQGLLSSNTFINTARLVIGANAPIGEWGIYTNGPFTNNTGGLIQIDRSTSIGLNSTGGTPFNNAGSIVIGSIAPVGQYGLYTSVGFNNNAGGSIQIDNATQYGLASVGVNFTNAASIIIGANTSVGQYSLYNYTTFTNSPCAILTLFAPLNNNSSFTNEGLFTVRTTQAHSNTTLTNNGVLSYPQGNPIPNVTNNDVIIVPKGTCSTSVLQIGGSNHFTVGTTWYKDPTLTTAAGTYSATTNTFTASGLTTGTVYPLYFRVTDNANGSCVQTTSITDTAQACGPCANATNLTTTNITANSATLNWVASVNPVQWQVQYKSTATGSKWFDVAAVAPAARSVTISGLDANQNYQWHIQAKCGTEWTGYSNVIKFKTVSATTSITAGRMALNKEEEVGVLQLQVLPNPSSSYFTLVFQSANTTAYTMRIFDVIGRTVESKSGIASYSTERIGFNYRPGVYYAQIIQGNKMVTVKLVKQ